MIFFYLKRYYIKDHVLIVYLPNVISTSTCKTKEGFHKNKSPVRLSNRHYAYKKMYNHIIFTTFKIVSATSHYFPLQF